jgi:hypothetical protein
MKPLADYYAKRLNSICPNVLSTMPSGFRDGPNRYGIKIRSIVYPPATLMEGAPYDPRPWSGVARHLEGLLNEINELEMQTLTQGDHRD